MHDPTEHLNRIHFPSDLSMFSATITVLLCALLMTSHTTAKPMSCSDTVHWCDKHVEIPMMHLPPRALCTQRSVAKIYRKYVFNNVFKSKYHIYFHIFFRCSPPSNKETIEMCRSFVDLLCGPGRPKVSVEVVYERECVAR